MAAALLDRSRQIGRRSRLSACLSIWLGYPYAMHPRRIESIDLARGVVMVLMAIDHVRCYAGVPAGGPTPGLFFTRWVTHFCAPAFVFLAGTGAFLYGQRIQDPAKLARYLVTRGLLLVLLEPTLIRFMWTFNVNYGRFVLAGVIWMLGWSMVALAAFVWLRPKIVGGIGLGIIVLQPLFGFLKFGWPMEFVYPVGFDTPPNINVLYTLVPWIGVMAIGYAFGAVVVRAPVDRDRVYRRVGYAATALFLVAAGLLATFASGDDERPWLFRVLGQQKYPASPPFLLMTLGPTIAVLPLFARARGWLAGVVTTFGRVPFFYYLLHIPLIHLAAIVVTLERGEGVHPEWYATAPYAQVPEANQWSLGLLYLVFFVVVTLLYLPCRWYANVKATRPRPWMKYV
jgi:uncharacterized membrane protein